MIREKALELMEKGIKVSHRHFTREEYLYLRGGQVVTEDGYYFADRFFKRFAGNGQRTGRTGTLSGIIE